MILSILRVVGPLLPRTVRRVGRRRTGSGDLLGAVSLFRISAESGDLLSRCEALLHLCVLHFRLGGVRRSRDAYRSAVHVAAERENSSAGTACISVGTMLGDFRVHQLPGPIHSIPALRDFVHAGVVPVRDLDRPSRVRAHRRVLAGLLPLLLDRRQSTRSRVLPGRGRLRTP